MKRRLVWSIGVVSLLFLASTLFAQDWRREPTFGATALTSGFMPDPWQIPLTAGGGSDPVNVGSLGLYDAVSGQPCTQAFITRSPDFRFHFTTGSTFNFLRFYVQTHNGADATLLVNQPDTTWRCNDDSFSTLMPSIDFNTPMPGQYDVWVGTYDASSHNPSTFYITELASNHPGASAPMTPPPQTPPPAAPPMTALNAASMAGNYAPLTVAPGFLPDPQTITGTSGGAVSAGGLRSVNGGSCAGYVSPNPDHVVTLGGAFGYLRIDAVSSDGGDTTMVALDPNGNYWCSDDDGGYPHPRIQGSMAAGLWRIWIGSYSVNEYHPYNLSVTEYTAP